MPSVSPVATVSDVVLTAFIATGVIGLLCVAYGVMVERKWFRAARYRLELLPRDAAAPLCILHLSDIHFLRTDRAKRRFMASLPRPDICVLTGDIVGEPEAAEAAVAALRPVRGRLASWFVLGSNDYFAPQPLNYAAYFTWRRHRHRAGVRGRSRALVTQLEADGWIHLKNRRMSFVGDGVRLEVVGMDDPHIERHDLRVAPRREPDGLGLAVVHSPDPVPELAGLGYDLILTGHTHGGQVRLPVIGALVTNSTLPRKLCMGMSRLGRTLLHVSPGLGTSRYAPFRFLCRPEATTIELVAVDRAQPYDRDAEGAEASARSNTRS
jgi:predicted MPP superfamily phosphohydrolase